MKKTNQHFNNLQRKEHKENAKESKALHNELSKYTTEQLRAIATEKGFDPSMSSTRIELIKLLKDIQIDSDNVEDQTKEEIKDERKYVFISVAIITLITGTLVLPVLLSLNLI